MNIPLAERLRPKKLEDYIGQEHLVGTNSALKAAIESGVLPSMIFWGPPGVGKTTLANIIANGLKRSFYSLSAVSSGVKDVRDVIEKAKSQEFFGINKPVLFIDEIHRFSKAQQDSLLGAVEKGVVTLIGATTENPSYEVISALLSRCQVYVLNSFTEQNLIQLLHTAIKKDEFLKERIITIKETKALIRVSGGDGRKLLNALELVVNALWRNEEIFIDDEIVQALIQKNIALYDKDGEMHFDIVSAFIKSMRGSDPNATVYWLARMVEGGEDPVFIARRMLILASEDIGNANPTALVLANNCFQAVNVIGWPESRIILSQTAIYLATSPKSNAAYLAIDSALHEVKNSGALPVPLYLRNTPSKFIKDLDNGKVYNYTQSYKNNFVEQEYLPAEISEKKFFEPGENTRENEIRNFLKQLWKEKYGY